MGKPSWLVIAEGYTFVFQIELIVGAVALVVGLVVIWLAIRKKR